MGSSESERARRLGMRMVRVCVRYETIGTYDEPVYKYRVQVLVGSKWEFIPMFDEERKRYDVA